MNDQTTKPVERSTSGQSLSTEWLGICFVCLRPHNKDTKCGDVLVSCAECGKNIKPIEAWEAHGRKKPLCEACFNTLNMELSGREEKL